MPKLLEDDCSESVSSCIWLAVIAALWLVDSTVAADEVPDQPKAGNTDGRKLGIRTSASI